MTGHELTFEMCLLSAVCTAKLRVNSARIRRFVLHGSRKLPDARSEEQRSMTWQA